MKKELVISTVCVILILGGSLVAHAADRFPQKGPSDGPPPQDTMHDRMDHLQGPWMMVLERLDLSEFQRQSINDLLDQNRKRSEKQFAELQETDRKLRRAMQPENFDAAVLRKLAAAKSTIETDLMIDRAETHHKIYELLDPEQKELVDLAGKLQRLRGEGSMRPAGPPSPPAGVPGEKGGPMHPQYPKTVNDAQTKAS
ncbi:Spy/CpxP family protein refolding chaperone [uncultured Desulfosarcina sp.]|uniref:Spy/CpxP family protein refolding chaperone n=1 Tax=uncultured Desulfosarcina sp. TaxID=218289 RepID=UPI0029C75F6A|nr:Spy/CpxP family protein refolding chaperone [uncultured Desulfosarcina sp.]